METETALADALSSVIDGYTNSGGPETYSVTEEDGVFHVVATNFLDKQGKLQQLTPILDTKISIIPKRRTRLDLFQEICQKLSESTDVHFGGGRFPFNEGSLQAQTVTAIAGTDVTARSLLTQLIAELAAPISRDTVVIDPDGNRFTKNRIVYEGGPLSWKLFYGPGWGYMLHIRKVTVTNQ
jgi:hypothetical protein